MDDTFKDIIARVFHQWINEWTWVDSTRPECDHTVGQTPECTDFANECIHDIKEELERQNDLLEKTFGQLRPADSLINEKLFT